VDHQLSTCSDSIADGADEMLDGRSSRSSHHFDSLSLELPKDAIENLVCQVIDSSIRTTGWYHPDVDLSLPRETDTDKSCMEFGRMPAVHKDF
jgi:hypothetical protein